MGDVYDGTGRKVGSVNAWSGVYDIHGNKVGWVNIFTSKVYDATDNFVGTADIYGNVRGNTGYINCKVPFWGFDVKDDSGRTIGSVGIAGAPEPMPDMQWRGAAALLLLCNESALKSLRLDELTFEYLSSPTSALKSKMREYGKDTVLPLLRSLVRHFTTRGASVKSERRRKEIRENRWSGFAIDPLLLPAHELVAAIGESATYELCHALLERDRSIQKAAALLVALVDSTSNGIIAELRNVLARIRINDSAALMLLTFVLANGGDVKAQEVIEKHALDNDMDAGGWIARTVDTAVLELLGWEKEVLF